MEWRSIVAKCTEYFILPHFHIYVYIHVYLSIHREMELWVLVAALTSTTLGCFSSLFRPTSPNNRQWTCTSLTSFCRACWNILILFNSIVCSPVPSEFRSVERGAVWRGSVTAGALRDTEWPLTIPSGPGVSSKLTSGRRPATLTDTVKSSFPTIIAFVVLWKWKWPLNLLQLQHLWFVRLAFSTC